MNIERTNPVLVHCIAICDVCDWREEMFTTASKMATQHVRTTGHKVIVETGSVQYVSAIK